MNKVEEVVSIIVPVFNAQEYIERCIKSLIKQSINNLEIILVNDGSTDNSLRIMEEYKNIDNRIKIINKKNGGVSTARNTGLMYSNGKYVSFVDSDDWCEEDMFENMYKLAENNNCDIISCGYIMDNKDGKEVYMYKTVKDIIGVNNNDIGEIIHNSNASFSVAKLYKSKIIKKNNLKFNESLSIGEDAMFVCDYLLHIDSAGIIGKALYHYVRCNNESLSTKYTKNLEVFVENIWNRLDKLYKRYPKFKELEHFDGSTRRINSSKMYIYNNYRKGSILTSKERRDFIKKIFNDDKFKKDMLYYKPTKFLDKVYLILSKINSPFIMDSVYSMREIVINVSSIINGVKK